MGIKQVADRIVNGVLLKPLGLKLGYRIGGDPVEDIARLMSERPVEVIADGGAYMGTFSQAMAGAFPLAAIHAFEPTPASHELLATNTAVLSRVHRHRLALGGQKGIATFYSNAPPLTNSLRRSSDIGHLYFSDLVAGETEVQVEVVTLEDFARERGITSFDVVKLDLQGNERDALLGMGDLLGHTQAALIEVQFVPLYEGAPLFSDIEALLREKGLVLYQLYELVRSPNDGRLLYGDALFMCPDVLTRSTSRPKA